MGFIVATQFKKKMSLSQSPIVNGSRKQNPKNRVGLKLKENKQKKSRSQIAAVTFSEKL